MTEGDGNDEEDGEKTEEVEVNRRKKEKGGPQGKQGGGTAQEDSYPLAAQVPS